MSAQGRQATLWQPEPVSNRLQMAHNCGLKMSKGQQVTNSDGGGG